MSAGVVIAGGGLAAQRSAEALRRGGYEGRVRIVTDELHAPYDRPPLSKDFLSGEREVDDLLLRPTGWHDENGVELILGDAAAGLDAPGRRLLLESGRALDFEHLVIATGSRPRALPGAEGYANVFTLRSLDDALALREVLRPGARLAVLGAGLIGQEVAATAGKAGAQVTMIEAEQLPLARALHPELAAWIVELQREEGVEVLLGTRVEALVGDGQTLEALVLSDGTHLELDALLVSIGIVPATEWVGTDVHELCAHPNFHVAGDAAGGNHWEQATHSGRAVAHAVLGKDAPPMPVTTWWSDVHGVRIQGLGDPAGSGVLEIDGSLSERSFTAVAYRDGTPVAATAVARPRDVPRLRKLLTDDSTPLAEAS